MQEEQLRRGSQAAGLGQVPLAYQYPVVSGTVPVARWAHASAAVDGFLYIYGGVGPAVLNDLAVLDTELMVWRALTPAAARPRDRPDKLHAAAMCALGNTLWLFGGQQGRKHLRTLYSLNTEVLSWRLVFPAGAAPAGREGHSLTAVNESEAFLFGGQGKKLYNDFFLLRQAGAEWVELKPQGRIPTPRAGHSMVWDGQDRLICFGGTAAGSTDSALYIYSISRNEWTLPESGGAVPSPRTHHSAVLVASHSMLVFGGCNAQGVFFNDAYVLDIQSMHWSRVQPLNTPPPPRYHHSCTVLGGKVVMYGGINPKQAFDAVVLLETNFGGELRAVAEELAARMTAGSTTAAAAAAGGGGCTLSRAAASAALGGPVCGPPLVDDLMKLQLRDLLLKRNMEELHVTAQHKAEAIEAQLKNEQLKRAALQKEVSQFKLISSEAEQVNSSLTEQLAEVQKSFAREQAEHRATSAALSDMQERLVSREQQLAEARQLLDSISAELGILSSRSHRLLQERDALQAGKRTAQRQQQQQQNIQRRRRQQQQQQQQQQENEAAQQLLPPLAGSHRFGGAAVAVAAQQASISCTVSEAAVLSSDGVEALPVHMSGHSAGTMTSAMTPASSSELVVHEQLQQATTPAVSSAEAHYAAVAPAGHISSHLSSAGNADESAIAGGCRDEPGVLCGHGQLEAACLLCICQRFLTATASSCSLLQPRSTAVVGITHPAAGASLPNGAKGGDTVPVMALAASGSSRAPAAAGLATAAVAACANEAAQYRQYLSISELARNRLEAENASLQQHVTDLRGQMEQQQQQLRVLRAEPAALSACTVKELNALEGTLEASTKAVRQVVLQRSIAEYQRQANEESVRCAVCMEAPRRVAFNCGHQTCNNCGDKFSVCPFCRQQITAKIRLFE